MLAEWIIVVFSLVMCVVFFLMTFALPEIPVDPGGIALFPRIVIGVLGISALALLVTLVKRGSEYSASLIPSIREFWEAWKRGANDEQSLLKRRMTYTIFLSVIYPWFILKIGFLFSTLLYVFLLTKLYRTKTVASVAFSLIVTGVVYGFFILALDAYVPPGKWLQSIFD